MAKGQYIAGRWVQGAGQGFCCTDPATAAVTWEGRGASQDQVAEAVAAARAALQQWNSLQLDDRVEQVRRFGSLLEQRKQMLAEAISRDTGKPMWESLGEVGAMVGKVDLSVQAYTQRLRQQRLPLNGAFGCTRYKPHGLCAVYGPFNLPGHLPNGHIVPALIAGNTVVFKPSEQAAAVGQAMVELWEASDLPAGVVNMVQGSAEVGVALAAQPGLDGVFFTGSSRVGRALSRAFADRPGTILALEMGGNNPLVVWDADYLEAAAYLTIQSAYVTAGQRCTCARRLIVFDGVQGDSFLNQLVQMIPKVRVGRYTDRPEPFMGPVISAAAAQRLLEAQAALIERGAEALVPMEAAGHCPAMLSPGLIDTTGLEAPADEELFGPILQVRRVKDFNAAVAEANRTAYGLAAALLSDDPALYERFYRAVRAGVVNWNRQTTGASGWLPFGGVGLSGNHRPSGYFAIDYCAYPVASIEARRLALPEQRCPGVEL